MPENSDPPRDYKTITDISRERWMRPATDYPRLEVIAVGAAQRTADAVEDIRTMLRELLDLLYGSLYRKGEVYNQPAPVTPRKKKRRQ